MAKYIIQGETLKAIADEVRDLTDITDEINPNEMIANMEQANADVAAQTEIIEQIRTALDSKAGSNAAEIGALIDQSGVLDSTEGTVEEKVEFLINQAELLKEARAVKFEGSKNITKAYLDCANLTSLQSAFQSCSKLKEVYVKNTQKINAWTHAFSSQYIVTLETLDFSGTTSLPNNWCGSDYLENIKIVPNTLKVSIYFCSRELTVESIQNIIDGLVDLTGATAQTLTIHADSKARITDEQKIAISNKNWNLA